MPKLIGLILAILFFGFGSTGAQQTTKIPKLGIISGGSASTDAHYHQAFVQALSDLGYINRKTVLIDYSFAEGNRKRFTEFAAEMVRLKNATSTIPIVMSNVSDPVALGFVKSLARPGGNVTGLSTQAPELSGKRLEVLKEILPKISRLAVLWQPGGPGSALRAKETETTARAMGIKTQVIEVKGADEFDRAFAEIRKFRAEALIPLRSPLIGSHVHKIVELALTSRLPVMHDEREFVEAGGLMFYGPDYVDLFRRAANFVDKILKGAKPADLPVEQPTKFELVINLKTAKQIGLTIPPNVLARADKVIK